jgi:ABC-2 type transport system ATP-binding protein
MSTPTLAGRAAVSLRNVSKTFKFFKLDGVSLELAPGQIMGLVGPNGAGKSTTIRILMGLLPADTGEVRVLDKRIPDEQAAAKRDIGYVSDDMRLFANATLDWHMRFIASIYPGWDVNYATELLKRFNLQPAQTIKGLSAGEHTKALLMLVLARRPKLLVLDEPTTGLDPVARHEVLAELMDVLQDDARSILFSSHNTMDVERISDTITFIDRGRIVDSRDKETFLERWRRLQLQLGKRAPLPVPPNVVDVSTSGHIATVTTNHYTPELHQFYERAGAVIHDVQRMTLEEIFVANVMNSRRERVS